MKSVLIVDDDTDLHLVYQDLLSDIGVIQVTTAQNGKDASRLAYRQQFDLIITDYRMPWVDGGELFHRLSKRKNYDNTPIIFVTGYSDEIPTEIVQDARVFVLEKPVPGQRLKNAVLTALDIVDQQDAQKPNTNIDIQLIDACVQMVKSSLFKSAGVEEVLDGRPYVKKSDEYFELDCNEWVEFESEEVSGYFGFAFRRDSYLWLLQVLHKARIISIEKAQPYAGQYSERVRLLVWRHLSMGKNTLDKVTVTSGHAFETQVMKPKIKVDTPTIVVPFSASFGDFKMIIKAKRDSFERL